MAQSIKFLLHEENSGFASRQDLAIAVNDRIRYIYTLGTDGGNTVGALNHPFKKGMKIDEVYARIEEFNSIPDGAVCRCGAHDDYHMISAFCKDTSYLVEIDVLRAMELATSAKRRGVRDALNQRLLELYAGGE